MDTQKMRTWAEINLKNLEYNYKSIKAACPESALFAGLCKANAYGHGAERVAKRLEDLGADLIAVSSFDEAAELWYASIKKPILILAPSPYEQARNIATLGFIQSIGDIETARRMNEDLGEEFPTLKVHIKLDTGMGRTGFNIRQKKTVNELRELMCMPNISVEGVFTHFAVSDTPDGTEYTKKQFSNFIRAVDILESKIGRDMGLRHCANSGAVVNYPEMREGMVRPGILLYGAYDGETDIDTKPVMTLKSRIYELHDYKAGDSISYGRTHILERDSKIAVLPIGYGDGLPRALSNKLEVLIRGERVRQVGTICMDMCMVDVTDLPECKVGDELTIFGEGLPVREHSEKIQTVTYELITAVSPRVPRVYKD